MKEKEIQAFIESLEVKALNGKQQSFLLEGEECNYGGDSFNPGSCNRTSNANCTNWTCEHSINYYNCTNQRNCKGAISIGGGSGGGTGGGSGANRMGLFGFPGLDL